MLLNWECPLIKVWNLFQSVRFKSHYCRRLYVSFISFLILQQTSISFNFLNYTENNLTCSSTQHLKQILLFCYIWFKSFCFYCGRNKIFQIQGKVPPHNSFPILSSFPQKWPLSWSWCVSCPISFYIFYYVCIYRSTTFCFLFLDFIWKITSSMNYSAIFSLNAIFEIYGYNWNLTH